MFCRKQMNNWDLKSCQRCYLNWSTVLTCDKSWIALEMCKSGERCVFRERLKYLLNIALRLQSDGKTSSVTNKSLLITMSVSMLALIILTAIYLLEYSVMQMEFVEGYHIFTICSKFVLDKATIQDLLDVMKRIVELSRSIEWYFNCWWCAEYITHIWSS